MLPCYRAWSGSTRRIEEGVRGYPQRGGVWSGPSLCYDTRLADRQHVCRASNGIWRLAGCCVNVSRRGFSALHKGLTLVGLDAVSYHFLSENRPETSLSSDGLTVDTLHTSLVIVRLLGSATRPPNKPPRRSSVAVCSLSGTVIGIVG